MFGSDTDEEVFTKIHNKIKGLASNIDSNHRILEVKLSGNNGDGKRI